jgi:hypothetical protein
MRTFLGSSGAIGKERSWSSLDDQDRATYRSAFVCLFELVRSFYIDTEHLQLHMFCRFMIALVTRLLGQ